MSKPDLNRGQKNQNSIPDKVLKFNLGNISYFIQVS